MSALPSMNFAARYGLYEIPRDPLTMTGVAMAATAAGTAISAEGTLAGGDYAQRAGQLQAQQDRMNAAQATASAQRKMFDDQDKTRLLVSASRARAGASGVDPGTGSALTNEEDLTERGSLHALTDLWNGQAQATGLQNQAAADEWNGEMKKRASRLTAMGTIASGIGQTAQIYGGYQRTQALTQYGYAGNGRM